MRVYERIIDMTLRETTEVRELQYGFMKGKGTIDYESRARYRKKCQRKIRNCIVHL